MRIRRKCLVVLGFLLLLGCSVFADDLIFIHHSVGQDWLDRGLRDALAAKNYIGSVHEITYGTGLAPDSGRLPSLGDVPGDSTDMHHWIRWFNDYLGGIRTYQTSSAFNRIIMFKSCFPNSDISSNGTEPGDPFSDEKTLANYRAVYRHPGGAGGTYQFEGRTYRALEDIFAAHPDVLFMPVTAPPLSWGESTDANGHRARLFNDWLKNDWLASYNAAHPNLHNVAVFNLFDLLAYSDNHSTHPNRLKQEYGGDTGDSHPNEAGDALLTQAFATGSGNFVDQAWSIFGQAAGQEPVSSLLFPAFLQGVHAHFSNSFVGVAVSNPGDSEARLTARGLSEGGVVISQKELASIPAYGQRAFLTNEAINPAGAARTLAIDGESAPIRGFFMVGENSLNRLDGVGDQWVKASTLYLPLARRDSAGETTAYIHNPNDTSTTATFSWIGTDGKTSSETSIPIPARGCVMRTIGQLFPPSSVALDGYLKVVGTQELTGCLVYAANETFVALPAVAATHVQRLLAPHFYVPGAGGGTQLRLINTEAGAVSVRVRAYEDGHELLGDETHDIAARAVWIVDLGTLMHLPVQTLGEGQAYSGYLDLDIGTQSLGLAAAVVGAVVFSGNNQRFAAALPLTGQGYRETLIPHVAQSDAFRVFTGLAVLNPGKEAADATVVAINSAGEESGRQDFSLQPGERAVDLLNGPVFFGPEFSQNGGYLRLSSTQPLVSFALFGESALAYMAAIGGHGMDE